MPRVPPESVRGGAEAHPRGNLEILPAEMVGVSPQHGTPTPQGCGPPGVGCREGPGPQGWGRGLRVYWYPALHPRLPTQGFFFFLNFY